MAIGRRGFLRVLGRAAKRGLTQASESPSETGLSPFLPGRRKFLRVLGRSTSAVAAALVLTGARPFPRRYTRASRTHVYPGPRKRFTTEEIRQPGKWLG
jgi:hypothetical protein